MGGSVAFTVRDPEGGIHRAVSWTNCFSSFINDMRIIKKDMAYVREYLDGHCKRMDEQDASLARKCGERPVRPGVFPIEYGLIVLDMLKDEIVHAQGYTADIGRVSYYYVFGEQNRTGDHNTNHELRQQVAKFFRSKRVVRAVGTEKGTGDPHYLEVSTLAEMDRLVDNYNPYSPANRDTDNLIYYNLAVELDMSPYKITRYDDNKDGFLQLRKHLEDLDFPMTRREQGQWKRFFERYEVA